MRFHFRASIRPIFKNLIFSIVLEAFHPLYEAKISNRSLSVVYGYITLKFFRGLWELACTSDSTAETKLKKSVFLGHPMVHVHKEWQTTLHSAPETFQSANTTSIVASSWLVVAHRRLFAML